MDIREENGITIITAENGKVLQRISDGVLFGDEVWLGKAFTIGGKRLKTPMQELPEHFTEIDNSDDHE